MNSAIEKLQAYTDDVALMTPEADHTFGELITAIADVRRKFANAEVKEGDVIVLVADYCLDAVAAIIAGFENKNVVVPLRRATQSRIESVASLVNADFVVEVSATALTFQSLKREGERHPLVCRLHTQRTAGLILISSGSTGTPKAIVLDLDKLFDRYMRLDRRPETTLAFLLFDHIGGFNTLFHTLFSGGAVVPCLAYSPEEVCAIIAKCRVTILPTTPTFLNLLLMSQAYKRFDLSTLKLITYGTEVMPEQTLSKLALAFPATRLKQTYGLSETGILSTRTADSSSLFIEIGGDTQHKVIDGILWIKSSTAMLGYLNADSPFTDGWLCTGDVVEVQDGKYRILGRKETIINVGGLKVYPAEIENVVQAIPGVIESVAVAKKNPVTGNVVALRVQIDPSVVDVEGLKGEIRDLCARTLDPFKVPRHISFQRESLHNERFKKSVKLVSGEELT